MAETILSPGVLARENDQSPITNQPTQAGAAIIGPAVKGPVGIPTLVTSYSSYLNTFGSTFTSASSVHSFLTSLSAYNYFENGGNTLLVTRVASGSFASATSSFVASGSESPGIGTPVFTLKTFTEGTIANSSGSQDSVGALENGTEDNLRWEIVSSNTSSGEFSLTIRRGNDIHKDKVVLESWNGLSLDPKAENYITKVIGDSYKTIDTSDTVPYVKTVGNYPNKSNYVYVESVGLKTPDYFDNTGIAKAEYTGSIPGLQSGSFGGASGDVFPTGYTALNEKITNSTNIQGLDQSAYTQSISLLANQDEYSFNVITAPGLIMGQATTAITSLINMVQERGDALAIVDPAVYGATLLTMTANALNYNSSYAACYAPWLQVTDPNSGQLVWVPASTLIPGVFAYNDNVSETWFAPAGLSRGGLSTVVRPERKLSQANRDTLYEGNVNPIASFPNNGTVVFGQKTLQKKASALDRINVRRLLIELKSYISQISDNLVFEQNSVATRNNFLNEVNPYLSSVQQKQGLYAFKVIMDDTNNTPDVIDRNQLIGQIFLQPTKTAEFILLDFNIMPTGATFPS